MSDDKPGLQQFENAVNQTLEIIRQEDQNAENISAGFASLIYNSLFWGAKYFEEQYDLSYNAAVEQIVRHVEEMHNAAKAGS